MRRLTAIMCVTISGGFERVDPDEFQQMVRQHKGELKEQTETKYLAIFDNAVDAVNCAFTIRQQWLGPSKPDMHTGIHIGDLHEEDEGIFGSGVEGVSQICQQAPAGVVYISRRVFDSHRFQKELRDRPGLGAERIEETGSEINEKLRPVYKVTLSNSNSSAAKSVESRHKLYNRVSTILIGGILILLLGLGSLWFMENETTPNPNNSVAVLPFDDFSPKGNQQWFSDGLTEEILNSLVRLEELYVPARTSSFAFKNKDISISQIADSLNVNYIVEGSVRRSNGRMRISVQLIKAESGGHLWSKTYERSTDSVFAVQKDIAENIVTTLDVYLDDEQRERMFAFGTQNAKAYEAFLKGEEILYTAHQGGSLSQLWEANKWYSKAIRLDSTFAIPYQNRADAYGHFLFGQLSAPIDTLSREDAYKQIIADFNRSIRYSNNPGNRLFYRFSKSYFIGNWKELPKLAAKISGNPEAYQSFVLTGGGNFPTVFIGVGYPSLARDLYRTKLNQDPLNDLFKFYDILALLALGKAGEALKNYQGYLKDTPTLKLRLLIFDGQLGKAKSLLTRIETEDNNDSLIGWKLLLGMEKMSKQELTSYFDEKDSPHSKKVISFAAGYPEAANRFASRIDTMLLGCKKLTPTGFGNVLIFDLKATPNLARCYEQAGIETEPYTLAGRNVRRIVPKDL